jgi:hypothetical protein
MSDEQLDRLVRDADPYRPEIAGRLDGAQQSLLEEIMSAPPVSVLPLRRPLRRRFAAAVAAAAAVAGLIGATALLRPEPEASPLVLPGIAVSAGSGASPSASAGAKTGEGDQGRLLDLEAARGYPRLLIDEKGWKLDVIYGHGALDGTAVYSKDGGSFEFGWSDDQFYQSRYKDRLYAGRPRPATVAGQPGHLFGRGTWDHEVLLEPKDGTFLDIRAGGMTATRFQQVLDRVVRVGPEEYLASLPQSVVTPGEVLTEATEILADVPLPPGLDVPGIEVDGINSPDMFTSRVMRTVTCRWLAEWQRADKAGDESGSETAAATLRGATGWKVYKDKKDAGGWSQQIRDLAAEAADADYPDGYENRLDCNR